MARVRTEPSTRRSEGDEKKNNKEELVGGGLIENTEIATRKMGEKRRGALNWGMYMRR